MERTSSDNIPSQAEKERERDGILKDKKSKHKRQRSIGVLKGFDVMDGG